MNVTSRPKVIQLISTKNKSKTSHKNSKKIHFQRRFRDRVGWILNDNSYEELKILTRKEGRFVKSDERGAVFEIKYKSVKFKVVYCLKDDSLVTVLSR